MARRSLEVDPKSLPRPSAPPRRTRVVIRKVGPWTVFRWSLVFYFSVMLIFLLALFIIYLGLDSMGVLDQAGRLIGEVFQVGCPGGAQVEAEVDCVVVFNPGYVFTRLFVVGCVMTALWSCVNLLIALLYNLVSDVIGGIEMTLVERR